MRERLGGDVIRCVGYGHVGDGNLHLNVTTAEYNKDVMAKIEPFVYEWTSRYNGSISAEHGRTHIIYYYTFTGRHIIVTRRKIIFYIFEFS